MVWLIGLCKYLLLSYSTHFVVNQAVNTSSSTLESSKQIKITYTQTRNCTKTKIIELINKTYRSHVFDSPVHMYRQHTRSSSRAGTCTSIQVCQIFDKYKFYLFVSLKWSLRSFVFVYVCVFNLQ